MRRALAKLAEATSLPLFGACTWRCVALLDLSGSIRQLEDERAMSTRALRSPKSWPRPD
jgi:hypothetical protein